MTEGRRQNELTVISKSKDLCKYVFCVTDRSPKKFRFSLVSRMQNISLDIVENLYRANDVFVSDREYFLRRQNYQHEAIMSLRILDMLALMSREQECILPKQYEVMSKMISDCQNLTGAWINSDKNRYKLE